MEDKQIVIPVLPLRGLTVLPRMIVHFDISREKSIAAVEKVMIGDQKILLVTQKNTEDVSPALDQLHTIGTIAVIKQLVKLPNNIIRVMAEGLSRAQLIGMVEEAPILRVEAEVLSDFDENIDDITREAMIRMIREKLEEFGRVNPKEAKDFLPGLLNISDLGELMDQTGIQFPWDYSSRQEILEALYLSHRYENLMRLLVTEIEVTRIRKEFQSKVKSSLDKNQREYMLREQMKIIREELGDSSPSSEADDYLNQLTQLKADKEIKEKIAKDIRRFQNMPGGSQEANVVRNYIETVLDLPWNKVSKDNNNITHAEEILEADHYGLDKVKERVLEYLAVRMLTRKSDTPIICLVGPPGTGKTSIARSVARALGKEYVRISLGGVRDEAEIRGHRKTYVGAMPGRIVEGLRQAGVSNPLMLLDEIDKVSSDYKGDTSSALLEVLDGEQNVKFRDHYVEMPVDLSRVLFIATANTTQTIPGPLLDRMEVIEVNSYTENEKFHIARNYLIGKQLKKHGLDEKQLSITNNALAMIVRNYTREAGVRNLERRIGDICRKSAREILEKKKKSIRITEVNLKQYLGKEKITFEDAGEENQIGIANGLAWTSVGGDTLSIEVNVMPGKGNLLLTGQMGDVMKESAQTALTYVRSTATEYQVPEDYFEKHDIHIHIPEGAVPKDGPSAGITMATAMLSAVSGRMVQAKVAMTGEITLRGRVLPIGGLKEKILAAKMAHMEKVLVPVKNRPHISELSREIVKGLDIVFVKQMDDVILEAFVPEKGKGKK